VEAKAPRTIKAMDISFIPLLVSSAIQLKLVRKVANHDRGA